MYKVIRQTRLQLQPFLSGRNPPHLCAGREFAASPGSGGSGYIFTRRPPRFCQVATVVVTTGYRSVHSQQDSPAIRAGARDIGCAPSGRVTAGKTCQQNHGFLATMLLKSKARWLYLDLLTPRAQTGDLLHVGGHRHKLVVAHSGERSCRSRPFASTSFKTAVARYLRILRGPSQQQTALIEGKEGCYKVWARYQWSKCPSIRSTTSWSSVMESGL